MKTFAVSFAALALAACSGGGTTPMAGGKDCCAAKAKAGKADACCAEKAPAECCAQADKQQVVSKDFLKPGDSRTFAIEYVAKVSEIPAGAKKVRLWVPVPQDTTVQSIKNLSFSKEPKIATEPKYGNKIAYWEIENPGA